MYKAVAEKGFGVWSLNDRIKNYSLKLIRSLNDLEQIGKYLNIQGALINGNHLLKKEKMIRIKSNWKIR